METQTGNIESILESKKLNWNVHKESLVTQSGKDVPDRFAICRDDNSAVLGVVSKKYQIMQNADIFSFVEELVGNHEAKVKSSILKNGGSRIGLTLEFPNQIFEIPSKYQADPITNRISISTSHDGSSSVRISSRPFRQWCSNGCTMAISEVAGLKFSFRHNKKIEEQVRDALNVSLFAENAFESFKRRALELAQKNVDTAMVEKFLNDLIGPIEEEKEVDGQIEFVHSTRKENIHNRITQNFENGVGNYGENAWHLYNGVTEWLTHQRGKNEQSREVVNLWGTGNVLNERALELVTAL